MTQRGLQPAQWLAKCPEREGPVRRCVRITEHEEDRMSQAAATTDGTFAKDVLQSDLPVLVDFWADWCAPCKRLGPTIDEISGDLQGKIRVFKLDVDSNQYGIQGIPTLILFSGGQPQCQVVGLRSKADLLSEIERAVGVKP